MTKDTNQDLQGAKKFLYSGPKRKETAFDEEDSSTQWSFNNTLISNGSTPAYPNHTSTSKVTDFDLDGVWSIAKNVNITSKPGGLHQPSNREGWTRNAGKSNYSRHGGMAGENESKNRATEDAGLSRNTSKQYSYSYGKTTEPDTTSHGSTKSDQLDNRPGLKGNAGAQVGSYGRYSVQQGGTSPRSKYFKM